MTFTVSVSNMLPYTMTAPLRAMVSMVLKDLLLPMTGALRLLAPEGFVWSFDDAEFAYKAAQTNLPSGVTAEWPPGVPRPREGGKNANVLKWASATYVPLEVYGCAAWIKVPDRSPIDSSNAFFVEVGYDSTVAGQREAAAAIP